MKVHRNWAYTIDEVREEFKTRYRNGEINESEAIA